MSVLSPNINQMSVKDDGSSLRESLMCDVPCNEQNLSSDVLCSLSHQRNDPRMCDFVFICGAGEHEIFAHRAVLVDRLPDVFKIVESSEEEACLILPDVEPFAVEALVNFVYTSKLELTPEGIWDVLSAADRFGMNQISRSCQEYILENMLNDSWLYARQLAIERGYSWLLAAVDDYIVQNFAALSQSTEFLQLPRLQVEIINKWDDFKTETDGSTEILTLVVNWCKVKLQEEDLIEGLMEHNHLVYLTAENTLKDCENSDLNETQEAFITDAQKEYIRQQSSEKPTSPGKSPRRSRNLTYSWLKDSSRRKTLQFRKNDLSKAANEFKLLATTALSEGCYVGFAVIASELVCISAYHEQTPCCSASISSDSSGVEDMGLSLMKPMIRGRCSVGVVELENKIFAVGGYDRGHCLNLVECFDQDKNEWVPITPLLCPRGRLGVSCLAGKLYAVGGSSGNSELKSAECFNPETKIWSKISDMSICRSNFGVCTLDEKLFAIGGTEGGHSLDSVEVFDPEQNGWVNVAPMQTGREGVCVAVINDHLYACGGYNTWHCLHSVECYSPKEDCWMMVAPLKTARRGAGAAVLNGKLFVVGGSDGINILKSVECYDPLTNVWCYVANMNSCRHNVGVTASNGYLFAVGGFDGVAFLNTAEFYDPELDKWCAFTQV